MRDRNKLAPLDLAAEGVMLEIRRELVNIGLKNLKDVKGIRSNTFNCLVDANGGRHIPTMKDYLCGNYGKELSGYKSAFILAVNKLSNGHVTGLTPSTLHSQLSKGNSWASDSSVVRTVLWTTEDYTRSWKLYLRVPNTELTKRYLRRIVHRDTLFLLGLNVNISRDFDTLIEISPLRSSVGFCIPLAKLYDLRPRLMELYRLCYEMACTSNVVSIQVAETGDVAMDRVAETGDAG